MNLPNKASIFHTNWIWAYVFVIDLTANATSNEIRVLKSAKIWLWFLRVMQVLYNVLWTFIYFSHVSSGFCLMIRCFQFTNKNQNNRIMFSTGALANAAKRIEWEIIMMRSQHICHSCTFYFPIHCSALVSHVPIEPSK